jgi:hypothetical protein
MFALAVAASILAAPRAQQGQPENPLPREEAREKNLRAYEQLLRSDVRTQKIGVITQMMQFTEEEDAAFWPIYRQYEAELTRLNDDRLRLIEQYAQSYNNLTPETANDLVVKALDLEARRTALKQDFFAKLKPALSPTRAARLMQIENQILLLVDLQIAASLPVVQ